MDDVPVKIVERYKPPPAVFHLPQATLNRLTQFREDFYADHPDYKYDCQLERAVVSQAERWRQLRCQQREERTRRQERRKEERQRALEARQKEMLGAVDYPSTDDLSSDEEEEKTDAEWKEKQQHAPPTTIESRDSSHEPKSISVCNFHNILQPTILSTTPVASPQTLHKRNSSLNYADFEYNMNSTPFDNIELKTINDLDILAQVLHQTQLEERRDQTQQQNNHPRNEDHLQQKDHPKEEHPHQEVPAPVELTMTTLAETKATLDSVNFHVQCDEDEGRSDPSHIPATPLYSTPMYSASPQQQLPTPEHFQVYSHQPVYSPQQHTYQRQNNYYVNGFGTPNHLMAPPAPSSVLALSQSQDEVSTKSRSVPDILRELKTELQQAENRRNRLHSHNEEQQPIMEAAMNRNSFRELAGPAQKLAQRISTMGFPLERVAKVVSLCGIDDKKIIEHLIPLGELMDLGFDESKISAALLKFNNNKDKALDYLIN
ncbi:uncharacterized protein LOC108115150 [Drosophila eugracilis]|uniref:uncharacterized protein LOC108115150 n=1 Tax=Drosophila eugracilis TaxID=29029 RepID=UPI0007E87D1E|nr:uncharacterized protein LOC108115150 [Drosophila eugracilis]